MSGGQGGARGPPRSEAGGMKAQELMEGAAHTPVPAQQVHLGCQAALPEACGGPRAGPSFPGNPSPRNGTQTWAGGEVLGPQTCRRGGSGPQSRGPWDAVCDTGSRVSESGRWEGFPCPKGWALLMVMAMHAGSRGAGKEAEEVSRTPPRRDARGRSQVDTATLGGT